MRKGCRVIYSTINIMSIKDRKLKFRCYSFPDDERHVASFELSTEDNFIPLYKAIVSAYPFNCRWPGHQRPKNQTEEAYFALFELSGSCRFSLKSDYAINKIDVRPLSHNVVPEIIGNQANFILPGPGYYTIEINGCHNALHLFVDLPSKDLLPVSGENIIYFGPGYHQAGTLQLYSGQTLVIDEGAVVFGRIIATEANNIRICGKGILDGSHNHERILFETESYGTNIAAQNVIRENTIDFKHCDDIRLEGITIRDSLLYNVRSVACNNLRINGIKIIGNWRYNSDGINMHNCCDVIISNCFLRTFDDSICIKGFDYILDPKDMIHNGKNYDKSTDILVEKCVIWCDWGRSLEIGAETRANEISNIVFRNCDLIHNSYAACDVQNVDYADIHNILFEDIRVEYDTISPKPQIQENAEDTFDSELNDHMPYLLSVRINYEPEYSESVTHRGRIRNLVFRRISVIAPRMPESIFTGFSDEYPIEDITVEEVLLNGVVQNKLPVARKKYVQKLVFNDRNK